MEKDDTGLDMKGDKMFFEKEYEINYYEQNVAGYLKESSLLHFFQDIATLSAEALGFGPSFVFTKNYAWVVLKYHIELYKEIKNFSSIKIKTEARGITKLYAFRDFEIYSPVGELLGKAVSAWALIDVDTRRMLPMQKVLNFVQPFENREGDLEFGKISTLENTLFQKKFDVRFDDIDVNRHVNNGNYVIWALETLPIDFRLKYLPKIIDIKFKKEISFGSTVVSRVQKQVDGERIKTLHEIKNSGNDEELSVIEIVWDCE